MTRGRLLVGLATAGAAVLPVRVRADGLIRFRNVSFANVVVEVRVGGSLDDAALYGTRKLARDEVWEVDTAGATAWWRREASPGTNDARYTDWQRIDSSGGDARVDI